MNYNPNLCHPLVQYFGVWNEPDGIQNFDDTNYAPNGLGGYVADFVSQYLSPAYNGVRQANASAYVLAPELGTGSSVKCGGFGGTCQWYSSWDQPLTQTYSTNIDVLTVHGYGATATTDSITVSEAASMWSKTVWLTETAYSDPSGSQITDLYGFEYTYQNYWTKAFYKLGNDAPGVAPSCGSSELLICTTDGMTWQANYPFYNLYARASNPTRIPSKIGVFQPSFFATAEDVDGNRAWDSPPDVDYVFGTAGDILITGDWTGDGRTKLGIFRPSYGMFALDINNNGVWDPGIDRFGFFGQNGDVPLVGDWNGNGISKIGIFRPSNNLFELDVNNDLTYDSGDSAGYYGTSGDVPILGDWTGDGKTKIGIYRPSVSLFAEDVDNNLIYDPGPGADKYGAFGVSGDTPIVGDWTGDGISKIGIYRSSTSLWALDINNNLAWDGSQTDKSGVFGAPGDLWVVGDWDGSGVSRAGIFRPSNGLWGLDLNGNLAWDQTIDLSGVFGASGDTPVVGRW